MCLFQIMFDNVLADMYYLHTIFLYIYSHTACPWSPGMAVFQITRYAAGFQLTICQQASHTAVVPPLRGPWSEAYQFCLQPNWNFRQTNFINIQKDISLKRNIRCIRDSIQECVQTDVAQWVQWNNAFHFWFCKSKISILLARYPN